LFKTGKQKPKFAMQQCLGSRTKSRANFHFSGADPKANDEFTGANNISIKRMLLS